MKKLNYWLASAFIIVALGCSKIEESKKTEDQTVTKDDAPVLKSVFVNEKARLWPNRIIPIQLNINGNIHSADIAQANDIFKDLRFKFVERTNEKDYVTLKFNSSDINYVGRKGGAQVINISPYGSFRKSFYKGLLNAAGLYNEFNKKNRDKYITINWDNVRPSEKARLELLINNSSAVQAIEEVVVSSYTMEGSYTGSKNGKPTMVLKNGKTFVEPDISKLHYNDINALNSLYRKYGWY